MSSSSCDRQTSGETAGDSRWPLERVLFTLAGSMALIGAALAVIVSPSFLLLTAFVGVSRWPCVAVVDCPASLVLRRVFSLCSVLYPHQEASS